jgi:hypothetical protein
MLVVGSFVGYYSFNFASQTDPSCLNPQKPHLNFSVDSYFISFFSHFFLYFGFIGRSSLHVFVEQLTQYSLLFFITLLQQCIMCYSISTIILHLKEFMELKNEKLAR